MPAYALGCHAALEKLAFGPAEARRVMKAIRPYVQRGKGYMPAAQIPSESRLAVQEYLKSTQSLPPQFREHARKELQQTLTSLKEQGLGTIAMPPRGEVASTIGEQAAGHLDMGKDLSRLSKKMTPQEQKMTEAIVGGHELDELLMGRFRTLSRTNPYEIYGHASPRVVLREHARVATLPEGYERTRQFQQKMRTMNRGVEEGITIPSEADLLERATRGVGGRPGITFGAPGTRLSRHAQKRVSQRIQEMTDALRKQHDPYYAADLRAAAGK
jgi:hypothetical protein